MEDKDTVTFSKFPKKFNTRTTIGWVPFAGSKRKADAADLGDNLDPDCRPAPAKQFAVDYDVANDILRDGFFYDPSIPQCNDEVLPMEDENMEEVLEDNVVVATKDPGEAIGSRGGRKLHELGVRGCHGSVSHSMHESQSDSQSLSMTGLSLVLSDEIQETLARKKRSADFILPKSLMDQTAHQNSMALVLWKPPIIGPLACTTTPTPERIKPPVSKPSNNSQPLDDNPWASNVLPQPQIGLSCDPQFPIDEEGDTVSMEI